MSPTICFASSPMFFYIHNTLSSFTQFPVTQKSISCEIEIRAIFTSFELNASGQIYEHIFYIPISSPIIKKNLHAKVLLVKWDHSKFRLNEKIIVQINFHIEFQIIILHTDKSGTSLWLLCFNHIKIQMSDFHADKNHT